MMMLELIEPRAIGFLCDKLFLCQRENQRSQPPSFAKPIVFVHPWSFFDDSFPQQEDIAKFHPGGRDEFGGASTPQSVVTNHQ